MKQGGSSALRVPARTGTGTLSTATGVCHVTMPPGRRWGGSCHSPSVTGACLCCCFRGRRGSGHCWGERREFHSNSPRPAPSIVCTPRVPEATGPAPHGQKAGWAEGVPPCGGDGGTGRGLSLRSQEIALSAVRWEAGVALLPTRAPLASVILAPEPPVLSPWQLGGTSARPLGRSRSIPWRPRRQVCSRAPGGPPSSCGRGTSPEGPVSLSPCSAACGRREVAWGLRCRELPGCGPCAHAAVSWGSLCLRDGCPLVSCGPRGLHSFLQTPPPLDGCL